jgi:hypothetical protein
MKKFLSTAAALGLVAGLAATASALELKVDGTYQADGYYINQGNGAAGGGGVYPWDDEQGDSDSWYWHTFRINPTLIVNDKVEVRGDLRLVDSDTVWGNQPDGDAGDLSDGKHIRMRKLWLVYDSPIGKWEVGRRPAGAWMGGFVNTSSAADRIMLWAPKMQNFKAYAFLQKTTEVDAFDEQLPGMENTDNDYYEVAGGYVAEGVNAWLGAAWAANKTNDFTDPDTGDPGSTTDMYRIKGYADFVVNEMFTLAGEFDYKWGQTEFNSGAADRDISSLAGIVSAIGNFGDLSGSLHYAYISGEDDDPSEVTAYDPSKGTGADFEPLYIMTGYAANVLNGDLGPNDVGTAVRTSGVHAIIALADFKASEDLTLHGGIGWGQAADTDWLLAEYGDVDDSYGWEVDLGMAYKLYQNLTYEVHFGWWAVGDFAELGNAAMETEDVYLLSHHLTMKF